MRDTFSLFPGQENLKIGQFLFNWIFLVSIEFVHNPNLAQIVFFFFYWPEFWREKIFGPETDKIGQFLAPETEP
jgi:hypothetical protein